MDRFKVALVALDGQTVPAWVGQRLADAGITFVVNECQTREDLARHAGDADVVWLFGGSHMVTAENLAVLPRCGALIRTGSGTDNVPVAAATERGIVVANTPEALSETVADHAIGLLFAVVRQIVIQDRLVRDGRWDRKAAWPRWHFRGQTLGLIGFGHVARRVVRKMQGFEMRFLAHDPYLAAETIVSHGARAAALDELLAESDFVSVHCPLTKDTRHLLGERQFRAMKPSAVLINTSRGPVLNEAALLRALREGWIAAAGLDVLEQEPPPPDHPLLHLDNVVVTPHIAAYSDEYLGNCWLHSVEAAIALARGHWPPSYVNRAVKPRWPLR